MSPFIAFAAQKHLGDKEDAIRKSARSFTDGHAPTNALVQDIVREFALNCVQSDIERFSVDSAASRTVVIRVNQKHLLN